MPNCKKCLTSHFNFQPCAKAKELAEDNRNRTSHLHFSKRAAPEGFRVWNDRTETVERLGSPDLTVVRSGLPPRRRMGNLTFPDAA